MSPNPADERIVQAAGFDPDLIPRPASPEVAADRG
jgi:hypothetical protein